MKLPDFEVEELDAELRKMIAEMFAEAACRLHTDALEQVGRAAANELRNRGRSLGIEGDSAHHGDALRAIESLAGSARTVEQLANAEPANDGGE